MNLLKNNGWKCLWRGHPAQPTDQLKPRPPAGPPPPAAPPPPPRVLKNSWGVGRIKTGCSRPPVGYNGTRVGGPSLGEPPPALIPGTDQAVKGGRHGQKLHSEFPPRKVDARGSADARSSTDACLS